jgi:hypothetical protein
MQIQKLDASGYRKFGITTGIIVGLLFGLLLPWLFGFNYPLWPWIVLAVLAGLGLILPLSLQPVYIGWMKFGLVMNWINTRLILGIIFYLMFLPIGLIMRLFGKDPMRRKLDKELASYRVISEDEDRDNVERPY